MSFSHSLGLDVVGLGLVGLVVVGVVLDRFALKLYVGYGEIFSALVLTLEL